MQFLSLCSTGHDPHSCITTVKTYAITCLFIVAIITSISYSGSCVRLLGIPHWQSPKISFYNPRSLIDPQTHIRSHFEYVVLIGRTLGPFDIQKYASLFAFQFYFEYYVLRVILPGFMEAGVAARWRCVTDLVKLDCQFA